MGSIIWHGLVVIWGIGVFGVLAMVAERLSKVVVLLGGDPDDERRAELKEELKT